jgi:hypothetical protein
MYVLMCALLALEWMDGFYSYLVFKSLSITGQCLLNKNSRNMSHSDKPLPPTTKSMAIFLITAMRVLIKFKLFMETISK